MRLVASNVIPQYHNIPRDFGLRANNDFLLYRNVTTKVVNGILNITELVLKQNVSEFNSEHFLQTSVTKIGTKMAQTFANIVMPIFFINRFM